MIREPFLILEFRLLEPLLCLRMAELSMVGLIARSEICLALADTPLTSSPTEKSRPSLRVPSGASSCWVTCQGVKRTDLKTTC